jgi:hypothetical protein
MRLLRAFSVKIVVLVIAKSIGLAAIGENLRYSSGRIGTVKLGYGKW